jgi:Heparinase II/III-like protein/Heparinase II/III N-terminus
MRSPSAPKRADGATASIGGRAAGPRSIPPRREFSRLFHMSLMEIAIRGQQEARKLIERLGPPGDYGDHVALLRRHAPALANAEAALRFLRETAPRRFFAGLGDPQAAEILKRRLPDECRDLVASATDTLTTHRVDLLGYRMLRLDDPIDWHRDLVSGRRTPLVHWSLVDALDADTVGDSKVVWELNRHQWVVRLAQAWTLTGDERYADACIAIIDAWLEANPPGAGINWASSLEVSYRLIAWCWVLLLIRSLPTISGEWVMKVLAAIWRHATHVSRYLSYYFSPNTHLTGEALGLFYAGVLFREFDQSPEWRGHGMRLLMSESHRQISADGVHFEQSTCYHRYTIEIYTHFVLLAARGNIRVPPEIDSALGHMVDFLVATRWPDGTLPAIGDADGGWLMPLSRRSADDPRGLFGVAAVLFDRPDYAWAARGLVPEVAWLFGSDGVIAFDELRPREPARSPSRIFATGGYAVMRSGWDDKANQLIIDVGPLGCPVSSGHGHADLLSIQCATGGQPRLIDAGNYCYTSDAEWRSFFRSTAAHNTVMIDGLSQCEPTGPFRWRHRPQVLLREWRSSPDLDFLDAEHDAFCRLTDPVVHRRRVLFIKPHYWIVVDDLVGKSRHRIEFLFQFAPMRVTSGPGAWTRAGAGDGSVLWVVSFGSTELTPALKSGERHPIRGWIAPDYGQREPAPALIVSTTAGLPQRTLTLLVPDQHGSSTPPDVHAIFDGDGMPVGVTFGRSRESVRFDAGVLEIQHAH